MEIIAILSHVLQFALAVVATGLCWRLYKTARQKAWLLVAAVFLEPIILLIFRAFRDLPLLPYRTINGGPGDRMLVEYPVEFPLLYFLSVGGLFLLLRAGRRD